MWRTSTAVSTTSSTPMAPVREAAARALTWALSQEGQASLVPVISADSVR